MRISGTEIRTWLPKPFVMGATAYVVASTAPGLTRFLAQVAQRIGLLVWVCDGAADDVEIQAALNALPATGGKIILLDGTYTLTAQIVRAIDDVEIAGCGHSTLLNWNNVNPVITAGVRDGWLFSNFATDGGGVDIATATESAIRSVWIAGVRTDDPGKIADGRPKSAAITYLSIPGCYYSYPMRLIALTADRQYYEPFKVEETITIDRMVYEVTTPAAPGKKLRLAIYKADENWQPTTLVVDADESAADAAAVVNVDLVSAKTLAGRYLKALISDGTPTMRGCSADFPGGSWLPTLTANPHFVDLYVARAYAAYPDPGTAWDTASGTSNYPFPHFIWLRISIT